jgi:hypothetical protein
MCLTPRSLLGRLFVVLLFVGALTSTGCGGGRGTVTGKVYMGPIPLKGGTVTFISTKGYGTASGAIEEDGSYKIERAPLGDVKIVVETESLNPKKLPKIFTYAPPQGQSMEGGGVGPKQPNREEMARRYMLIPQNNSSEETTELTYTVTRGNQEHNITLK